MSLLVSDMGFLLGQKIVLGWLVFFPAASCHPPSDAAQIMCATGAAVACRMCPPSRIEAQARASCAPPRLLSPFRRLRRQNLQRRCSQRFASVADVRVCRRTDPSNLEVGRRSVSPYEDAKG